MPYDTTDPRSQLLTQPAPGTAGIPRAASYRELRSATADERHPDGSATWWVRSQAMVIAQTDARPGDALVADTAGEHVVMVLDGASVTVAAGGDVRRVDEDAVVIVPPGRSTVTIESAGTVIRVFAAALEPSLASRCANAADFEVADANVAPFHTWPAPHDGYRLRIYPIGRYPAEPGRLGRIFRCTTVMVNVFEEDREARDPAKLSPHHHDDFEQVSLQVAGDYVHHMRVAWTPDSTTWRDDEHQWCSGPAVVVIPPPLIHTSQSLGAMRHWLIDVFAPPRIDFSQRPGWVLNADDYPMPAG